MDNLHHWEPRDEAVYSRDFGELPMYGADCPKIICEWVNAGFTIYEARIAALEAERDELRRKLDALKPKPPECAIDEPGGDEDDWIAWDEAMANYRLIVEGQS